MSRPAKRILEESLLDDGSTYFDYGCGYGDDLRLLQQDGYEVCGWDPVHRSEVKRIEADVVNLGYVVNVIESQDERNKVIQQAWDLTTRVLVVSARLEIDRSDLSKSEASGDGFTTSWGTFQKYYGQTELREWINQTLQVEAVAASPGVMFVFRDEGERQEFLASRFRSYGSGPRLRQCDLLFDEHANIIEDLCEFVDTRGRLPAKG